MLTVDERSEVGLNRLEIVDEEIVVIGIEHKQVEKVTKENTDMVDFSEQKRVEKEVETNEVGQNGSGEGHGQSIEKGLNTVD